MQPGADIKAVFSRLQRAATKIEQYLKFAHDDHLGYITSCPTNLGTAMRASVHIKLPKLMNNKEQFNKIAAEYYVQIRGIHGEHTETNDGVFDISNLRRLGRSEKDLVQDMINGVRALMEAEAALWLADSDAAAKLWDEGCYSRFSDYSLHPIFASSNFNFNLKFKITFLEKKSS